MKLKTTMCFLGIWVFLLTMNAQVCFSSVDQYLYLYATTGWDYNSNPAQKPGGSDGALIPGHGGAAYSQNAKAALRVNPQGPFDVQGMYEYYQIFNMVRPNSLYDSLMHTFTVRPSYLFGSTQLSAPFIFNMTDVDASKYSNSYVLQPTVFHRFNQEWGLEVAMNLARLYVSAPVSIGEYNRSGRAIGFLAGLYYFFDANKGYIQARFGYDNFDAVGSNNDGSKILMMLNAFYQPHPRIKLNPFISLGIEPYNNSYTDGITTQGSRRDTILNIGAIGTVNIYKWIDFNVHYYFTKEWSNINLYVYDRHMVGGLLSFTYGNP
jgi:hypothetical protein